MPKKNKKLKHTSRKATPEQLAAMNRELVLRGASWRYELDEDGRLTKVEDPYKDWW